MKCEGGAYGCCDAVAEGDNEGHGDGAGGDSTHVPGKTKDVSARALQVTSKILDHVAALRDGKCKHLRFNDDGEAEGDGETDVDQRLDAPLLDDAEHAYGTRLT